MIVIGFSNLLTIKKHWLSLLKKLHLVLKDQSFQSFNIKENNMFIVKISVCKSPLNMIVCWSKLLPEPWSIPQWSDRRCPTWPSWSASPRTSIATSEPKAPPVQNLFNFSTFYFPYFNFENQDHFSWLSLITAFVVI